MKILSLLWRVVYFLVALVLYFPIQQFSACLQQSSLFQFKSIRRIIVSSASMSGAFLLLQCVSTGENAIFTDRIIGSSYANAMDEQLSTRQKIIRQTNNILSGPLFEAIRKMDEADADSIITESTKRYFLLVPIVELYENIVDASVILQDNRNNIPVSKLLEIKAILEQGSFDSAAMKKTFNRYGDNIYYADPARANMYLAGGALPGTVQTEQYLLRNDIITNVQNLRSDITDFLAGSSSSSSGSSSSSNSKDISGTSSGTVLLSEAGRDKDREQEMEDMLDDFQETLRAFRSYLERADPEDWRAATDIVQSQRMRNRVQK